MKGSPRSLGRHGHRLWRTSSSLTNADTERETHVPEIARCAADSKRKEAGTLGRTPASESFLGQGETHNFTWQARPR